ncbi:MAG: electron transfer flavoprotein subunit alpha/FixB family protein [Flavobacteriales bacterium]|nr:electron transfer flavoprotein subunit alpha/FixB family protein [Bacteroidota bacterium]MCB9239616.1 electron transfer flavoprotein subunit alpha/FixB family protein [Flavobacteriales bacterium]
MIAVYIETDGGSIKKSSLEALAYGADLAAQTGDQCAAVLLGSTSDVNLGDSGANKTLTITGDALSTFTAETFAAAMDQACAELDAHTIIISNTYNGKSIAPRLAVKRNAAIVSGVVSQADTSTGFSVRKSCFSNKAFAQVAVNGENRVITLIPNSYEVKSFGLSASASTSAYVGPQATVKSVSIDKVKGKIPLTEAELVVSAGRGMKGPENWGMIEELADILGAATACSKPVSDMDWRPHSEHVGQTGITIKPNLYIAVGISGAIQHLAGVSSSKVICVINTDPEAPFFKAADYGIVGDAFEVVPKLIARAKELKTA